MMARADASIERERFDLVGRIVVPDIEVGIIRA